MFIPFLAAAAVATAFAQLGALSVQMAILTKALQVVSIAFIVVAIAAIASCALGQIGASEASGNRRGAWAASRRRVRRVDWKVFLPNATLALLFETVHVI